MAGRTLLAFVVAAALCNSSYAQECDTDRPLWVSKGGIGYAFDYFVGQGEDGSSPVAAREVAVKNAISAIVAKGLITVETLSNAKQTEKTVNDSSTLISEISEEVRVKGHSENIQGLEQVETHLEQCGGVQRAFALVRIPKKVAEEAPSSLAPLAKSAIAPSWGQFSKGHSGKGAMILIGEGLLIPTAIVTFMFSQNAGDDAAAATKQADREFYLNRRDQMYVGALVAGGAAIALYAFNLIDAAASPQENLFAEHNATTHFVAAPTPDGGGILGLLGSF